MSEDKKPKKKWSRRKFILRSLGVGAGVMIGGTFLGRHAIRRQIASMADETQIPYSNTAAPNVWIEVTPENKIIVHSPKVEMGQGTFTSMAQMAADELEVNLEQVEVVHANTATGNVDGMSTGGSTSTYQMWATLREMSATMREMIKAEAATMMGVSAGSLSLAAGVISGGGKSMSYGDVVKDVKEWTIPDTPELKDPKTYKYSGKPIARVDLKDKVIGAPMFGIDAQLPGMLYGSVVRPSQVDATFVSANTDKASKMPGVVKVVLEKDFVGVVAKSRTEAENAKKAIEVEWKVNKVWEQEDIIEMTKVGKGTPYVIQKEGKAKGKLKDGTEGLFVSEYESPIGAHAQLEPNGALVDVKADGTVDVYISTQVVSVTRTEVADRLGLDVEKVVVHPMYLGGGFGRRLHTPNAMQAAVLSKAVGKPVHCFFNRKEEFQNDTFRPPTHNVLKAVLTEDGKIDAIEHNISSGDVAFGSVILPSIAEPIIGADIGAWRGGMITYSGIPNYRAVSWRVKLPFATSFWRSLGLLANTFAMESFMDELAIKAGKDPVQFRLDQIKDDEKGTRLKNVIKAAAEKSGWGSKPAEGRALGFACSVDAGSPCAHVVEVSVENKKIKVHKVTCAFDPGYAINPDQVKAQCEGCIIMGMSAVLFEKMDIKNGVVGPKNYGSYPMLLMKDAPKEIDTILLDGTGTPGAVGEPPMGPIGAAIANAVYQLTNQRLRSFPFKIE